MIEKKVNVFHHSIFAFLGAHDDGVITECIQLAPVETKNADACDAHFFREFHRFYHVWRIAARGNSDEDVSLLSQCFELTCKYLIVSFVIAKRSDDADIFRQIDCTYDRLVIKHPCVRKINRKVRRGGGTATIPNEIDGLFLLCLLDDEMCDVLDHFEVKVGEQMKKILGIFPEVVPMSVSLVRVNFFD